MVFTIAPAFVAFRKVYKLSNLHQTALLCSNTIEKNKAQYFLVIQYQNNYYFEIIFRKYDVIHTVVLHKRLVGCEGKSFNPNACVFARIIMWMHLH